MNVKGYELVGEWKTSNIGYTAKANRGGKTFFLKKYGNYKMPRHDESTTPKLYNKLKKNFEDFMQNRIAINEALKDLAGPGGNIILPSDWFVDDICYVEASEFVANLIEDEDILKLPMENKLFIMMTAAGALHNIHRKKIVHSDLKRSNLLAARNGAGNTVAKIIDFDKSYFEHNIRAEELGGDQKFMSPELAYCFIVDFDEEALKELSTKSDIFSLGLIFHNYLVTKEVRKDGKKETIGLFPEIEGLSGSLKKRMDKGEVVCSCEAVLSGAKMIVSKQIKEKYLSHLIANMLQPNPADRPTAHEVLQVLRNKSVMDVKAESPILIEGESVIERSIATTSSDTERSTSTEERIEGFCEPWEGHDVIFDTELLKSKGFVAMTRAESGSSKVYKLIKESGQSRNMNLNNMLMLGYATKKGASTGGSTTSSSTTRSSATSTTPTKATVADSDDSLWDSDAGYRFDMDAVKGKGYVGVKKQEKNGVRGYALVKAGGDERFMNFKTLKMLGFVVKK